MGDCNTLKTFPNPHHCDPHLDQTKFNDLLPLTIDGVLDVTTFVNNPTAFVFDLPFQTIKQQTTKLVK